MHNRASQEQTMGNLLPGSLYLQLANTLVYPLPICRQYNLSLVNYRRLAEMKVNMNRADFLRNNLMGMAKDEGDYFVKEYNLFNKKKILPNRKKDNSKEEAEDKRKKSSKVSSGKKDELIVVIENEKLAEDQLHNNTKGTADIMEVEESNEEKNAEEENDDNSMMED
eukprot:6142626-Ditylum_brightwellii.AAC.1